MDDERLRARNRLVSNLDSLRAGAEAFAFYGARPEARLPAFAAEFSRLRIHVEEFPSNPLTDLESRVSNRLGSALIEGFPRFARNLRPFQDLVRRAAERAGTKGFPKEFDVWGVLQDNQEAIDYRRDAWTSALLTTKDHPPIEAFLLGNIVLSDGLHDGLLKYARDLSTRFGLPEFDVEEMLSYDKKVAREGRWVTDTKAMRDATAHGWFKLDREGARVQFDHHERGYSWSATYTLDDLRTIVMGRYLIYSAMMLTLIGLDTSVTIQQSYLAPIRGTPRGWE